MRIASLLIGLALAAPAWACQPSAEAAVAAVNAVRARATACGSEAAAAAGALRWSAALAEAARRHAVQLSQQDRIDHPDAPGRALRERLLAAGYVMKLAAENLAGGPETLDEALAQWLASPAHCENLMLADVSEMGLACVSGPGRYERYWVLLLASPAAHAPKSSPGR